MAQQGNTGEPAAPDVGGNQDATAGSPPQTEGKTPGNTPSPAPSGLGSRKKDGRETVPWSRFNEINQQKNALQQEVERLRQQQSQVPPAQTDADFSSLSSTVQTEATKLAEELGVDQAGVERLLRLQQAQAQVQINDFVSQAQATARQEQEAAQLNEQALAFRNQMYQEFPQLADTNSEFFLQAYREFQQGAGYDGPAGELQAARAVALRMGIQPGQQVEQQAAPEQLEGGSNVTPDTPGSQPNAVDNSGHFQNFLNLAAGTEVRSEALKSWLVGTQPWTMPGEPVRSDKPPYPRAGNPID